MSARTYSLEALRDFRLGRSPRTKSPSPRTLADIPADAAMDEGIALGCWNGKKFVSWEKWRATAPIEREEQ